MLFMPTNVIPDLKSGIGLGVIDATLPMKVSWQVNGDYPVMTGMKITICLNNEASTEKYTTGKITFQTPFYGADALGNLQYYSYTISASALSAAGITNGNEYKMVITQYYMDGGAEASVTQNSASVFITRLNPTFTLTTVPATVTSSTYTFNLNYSQAQGDTLDWVRYEIAQGSDTDNPIYDSGNIYGAAQYLCTYRGFRSGYGYSFRATGQTSSGVLLNTGWQTFTVSYSVTPTTGTVTVGVQKDVNGIVVDWSGLSTASGQSRWAVYREQEGSGVLVKAAEVGINIRRIIDYGCASGQGPYDYLIAATDGAGTIIGSPVKSGEIRPVFYRWTLLTAESEEDGSYTVTAQYHFKYNMDAGNISNNNTPNVLQNFTANPTVQPAPQNYRSGSLKALVGTVTNGKYTDSLTLRNTLMALSVTKDPLFLKSSKGDVMRIRINGAITAATSEHTEALAQTVSVPWIALDDAAQTGIWGVSEAR